MDGDNGGPGRFSHSGALEGASEQLASQMEVVQDNDPFAVPDLVEEYLHRHFSAEFQEAEGLKATPNPYRSTYTWVLRVRIVQTIFQQLRIGTGSNEAHSNILELDGTPITIECNHIFKWLHIKRSTFETNRTHVKTFRNTWTDMLSRNQESWAAVDKASLLFQALDAYFRAEDERLPTLRALPPNIEPGKRYAVEVTMGTFKKLRARIASILNLN